MNILLILLGSNISYLLNNRIETAINFVSKFNDSNIDWFLSGGIKNIHEDTVTEAQKMSNQILSIEHEYTRGNSWNYILDVEATNTAENFIMVRNYLRENNKYNKIYVITSRFHYKRAKSISDKILDNDLDWILGDAILDDSEYWENIHIKNVKNDVNKAFNKFPI